MSAVKKTPSRVMAYLSGAPRVSTRPDAAATGPRAHVVSAIRAFQKLGWQVIPYIVGDQVPRSWVNREVDLVVGHSWFRRLLVDVARVGLSGFHMIRAPWKVRHVHWVYERFGLFQALGFPFHRRGIPWVVESGALFFEEARLDRASLGLETLARWWELWVYRTADVVVAVSDVVKEMLVEHGIPGEKILVIPNAVDEERFDPDRVDPIRIAKAPVIGFVGNLVKWQALDRLIHALHVLLLRGKEFHLVVVGDGPYRSSWESLARERLGDRAHFVGRKPWEEIPRWIAGFDVAYSGQIPTLRGEVYHSPLKVFEYMAMARVVVASRHTHDTRHLIRHGVNGFITDPEDMESLVHTLEEVWVSRERWVRIGMQARQDILARHTWTRRYSDMLRELRKRGMLHV